MSPAEIKEVILDILSDIAPDEDLSELKDDVPLREQLELDSMDFLDIVMELRNAIGCRSPKTTISNWPRCRVRYAISNR